MTAASLRRFSYDEDGYVNDDAATAAKAGLFKMIWLSLLALKTLVLAGVVALAMAVDKLLTGGGNEAAEAEDRTLPRPERRRAAP